ncbi:hypothetical protein [Paraglaciecola aestuariivivens]
MSKLKKVLIAALVLIGLGAIAKEYNQRNHMKMALNKCGSKENIASVDSSGFACK